ncbi:hypothetical protein BGX30_005949 [Mortierella sp. GBA39]|nr:hypothetical protein BGX30_005949 [Mortierella sp. GBA39]
MLPSLLFYYIADGLLGLPKTIDWLSVAVQKTREATRMKTTFQTVLRTNPTPPTCYYAGEFIHPVYGKIVVTLQKDRKALQMRYMTLDSRLAHYHYESFKGLVTISW